MNKISLYAAIAAVAVFGFSACQKTEDTPAPQEEVQVEEEPAVKSAARILNSTAEDPEVQEAVGKLLLDISKGKDWHHMALSVAREDEEGNTVNYLSGELGVVRGETHLLEVDLDLMVRDLIPITGTLDLITIVPNYTKALLAKTDLDCDYYLLQANEGIKIKVMGFLEVLFMRTEDEEGSRIVDLFLLEPGSEPIPLSKVLELLS